MSSKVNAEQLDAVRLWASQGIDLNGIQKQLAAEFDLHLTYMEVRFLLLDHNIEIARPQEQPTSAPAAEPTPQPEPAAQPSAVPGRDPMTGAGSVKPTLSLDDIQIPGTILSGKCEFPSGTKVAWQIDQMGRLDCSQVSGTMTPEEQQAFVFELRQILSKM